MTQEDKAKAYDEAIERAKEIHNEHKAQPFNIMLKIFPELKESEDEKIRKNIIIALKSQKDELGDFYKSHNTSESELVDWIEKQGEQKPIWTDNDRTMAFTLLRDIDQMTYISKEGKNERLEWLNLLEDRFEKK